METLLGTEKQGLGESHPDPRGFGTGRYEIESRENPNGLLGKSRGGSPARRPAAIGCNEALGDLRGRNRER
jgi:hypothetical protein